MNKRKYSEAVRRKEAIKLIERCIMEGARDEDIITTLQTLPSFVDDHERHPLRDTVIGWMKEAKRLESGIDPVTDESIAVVGDHSVEDYRRTHIGMLGAEIKKCQIEETQLREEIEQLKTLIARETAKDEPDKDQIRDWKSEIGYHRADIIRLEKNLQEWHRQLAKIDRVWDAPVDQTLYEPESRQKLISGMIRGKRNFTIADLEALIPELIQELERKKDLLNNKDNLLKQDISFLKG